MTLPTSLSKGTIRRAFDRARDTYARAAMVQGEVARTCASRIPAGHYPAVIEIGAGGGVLTEHLVRQCTHDRYVAVDMSPEMLRQVDMGMLTSPEFMVADGECLDLPQESFDLLASSSTMQWYHAPEVAIHDNLRLLKHGGSFSLSIFVEGTYAEFGEASEASGFGSMLPMRPSQYFVDILQDAKPALLEWEVVPHVSHFSSVSDLLRAHRATGATATPGQKQPSKSSYKRFISYLEDNFRDPEGIRSTSVILHLWGRR